MGTNDGDDVEQQRGGADEEDESRDAVGDLPSPSGSTSRRPRPSLHGLDRELSSRGFGASPHSAAPATASHARGFRRGGSNVSDGSGNNGEGGGQKANYKDYLRAQRAMQSRRHLGPAAGKWARLAEAVREEGAGGGAGGVAGNDDSGNAATNGSTSGNEDGAPSVQANLTALAAVAKMRKRANVTREQKTMRALAAHGRRGSCANLQTGEPDPNGTDWAHIFDKLGDIDEDGHFDHEGHTDDMIPWYAPPLQRQRWGEDTQLPHVNWGDLFFDLFYVAMAYNLGVMLVSAMNTEDWLRGIIYFVGTFGPLWTTWEVDMFHNSRYTTVDYAHRMFEVIRYLFVSLAVCHVKPVELLSDPKSLETLLFTAAIMCEAMMNLALCFELYFVGEGDREAIRNHTMTKIKSQQMPTLLVYIGAFVAAVVNFVRPDEESSYDKGRLLASDPYDAYDAYESASLSEPLWKLADLPLTLTAVAYLVHAMVIGLRKVFITSGKRGDIRDRYVPHNVDYVIHRYGEWILLMIGEGILSLTIVETVEVRDYYIITTFGILTIIFIQILKFESEPSHGHHAMWKSLKNAMCYSYLMQLLSMSLIVFGVTYKVFLKDVLKEKEKEDAAAAYEYEASSEKASRMLAASPAISDEASAGVFAYSLTMVLLSMELMCLTHGGIKRAFEHLVQRNDEMTTLNSSARGFQLVREAGARNLHWPVIVVFIFKLGLYGFTVSLSQWTTDSAVLTLCGCFVVIALAGTQILTHFLVNRKEVIDNLAASMRNKVGTVLASAGETAKRSSVVVAAKGIATPRQSLADNDEDEPLAESLATKSNHSTSSAAEENQDKKSGTAPATRRASRSATATIRASDSTVSDVNIASGVNNSFDAIIVADLNGIITQVNDTAVALFGYANKKEMVGKNLSILVGGGDALHHDSFVKAFKNRVTTHDNPHHKVLGRQRMLHGRKADGTEFPCIIGIKMVNHNTRVAGYIRDMSGVDSSIATEEKDRVYDTMDAQEAVKRVVNDDSFDAIIAVNEQGKIQRANKTAVAEFGYTKSELRGKAIAMLVTGVTAEQLTKENDRTQVLLRPTRKDGTEFQAIVASAKIKDATNMYACYIRNIDPVKDGIKFGKDD